MEISSILEIKKKIFGEKATDDDEWSTYVDAVRVEHSQVETQILKSWGFDPIEMSIRLDPIETDSKDGVAKYEVTPVYHPIYSQALVSNKITLDPDSYKELVRVYERKVLVESFDQFEYILKNEDMDDKYFYLYKLLEIYSLEGVNFNDISNSISGYRVDNDANFHTTSIFNPELRNLSKDEIERLAIVISSFISQVEVPELKKLLERFVGINDAVADYEDIFKVTEMQKDNLTVCTEVSELVKSKSQENESPIKNKRQIESYLDLLFRAPRVTRSLRGSQIPPLSDQNVNALMHLCIISITSREKNVLEKEARYNELYDLFKELLEELENQNKELENQNEE